MAAAQGISKSSVSRIWQSHNIKPHRSETFKLSRDPRFLEKLTDVVGLYLNPPDQAIVPLRGREEPNSGFATHPAPAAAEERALRHHDP